ncbi:MAG: ClbS/DfsB family four-helix bundle protein [Nitrososphaerales archaeon]
MKKSELMIWLHDKYREWQDLLKRIGTTRMEEPGVSGDWSMKDIVSHLTAWNHWLALRMKAAVRGEPEPAPPWPAHLKTDDEISAWIHQSTRGRALSETLETAHLAFQEFLTVVESLPADATIGRVEPDHYIVWLGDRRFYVGEFFENFRDHHEANVRAWLARKGK